MDGEKYRSLSLCIEVLYLFLTLFIRLKLFSIVPIYHCLSYIGTISTQYCAHSNNTTFLCQKQDIPRYPQYLSVQPAHNFVSDDGRTVHSYQPFVFKLYPIRRTKCVKFIESDFCNDVQSC